MRDLQLHIRWQNAAVVWRQTQKTLLTEAQSVSSCLLPGTLTFCGRGKVASLHLPAKTFVERPHLPKEFICQLVDSTGRPLVSCAILSLHHSTLPNMAQIRGTANYVSASSSLCQLERCGLLAQSVVGHGLECCLSQYAHGILPDTVPSSLSSLSSCASANAPVRRRTHQNEAAVADR